MKPRLRDGRTVRAIVILAAGLFLISACGRKGAPLPPRPVVPAAVGDFRAEPGESDIVLSWTRPTRNNDGSALKDLLEFHLSRATVPLEATPAAAAAFSFLARVRADQPENAQVQGSLYAFRDDAGGQGLPTGRQYRYRVQAVNRQGDGGAVSSEIAVQFTAAPPPPFGLKATAGDGTVTLEWQAPPAPAPVGAGPTKGYNVYRGVKPGVHEPAPINANPVLASTFRDAGVENDTPYYYVVRSVANDRPPWRESVDSPEVSIVPQDFIPPAPPRGLVAIPGDRVVALTWDASAERDILGYLVYRREPPQVTPVRLTAVPIPGTTFTDRSPRAGAAYVYTVTAVDRSTRRNESAPSVEVEVSLP